MLDSKQEDLVDGRKGLWMQTSLGGKFFPADPRPEEIFLSDIANGLALDCRYAGQGAINRFYSVAEHSYHMAVYSWHDLGYPSLSMATLLHDAAEAYLNDLPRAVKRAVGNSYSDLEDKLQDMIMEKYQVLGTYREHTDYIKSLDRRMVALEKAAIMRYPQPWAHDVYVPLEGVTIGCYTPVEAKTLWLLTASELTKVIPGVKQERAEI